VNGNRVIDVTETKIERATALLKTLAVSFSSFATVSNEDYPYVTIPNFEARTEETLVATNASFLAWCPLVPITEGEGWNSYSQSNYGWASESAGGSPLWAPLDMTSASYEGYFAPQWQYAPLLSSENQMNKNRFEVAEFSEAAQVFVDEAHEVLSATHWNPGNMITPAMSLIVPAHKPSSMDTAGVLELHLDWETLINDAVPVGTGDLLVEVEDTCGSRFTYTVNGTGASFLKEGFLFTNPYSDRFVTASIASFGSVGCGHTMTVFPTDSFRADYNNNDSVLYTTLVLVVFFVMIMAFLAYACAVRSRQKTVKSTIDKTTAIVSNIFPQNVQDRIYNEAKQQVENERMAGPTKSILQNLAGSLHNHTRSAEGKPIADLFTECTIMFGDIVGFTAWSSTREPSQVFTLLEHIYRHFDSIAARRRVFKVETVGDCYVAVAGLPEQRRDHAVAMARFANDCMSGFNGLVQQLVVELGPDTEDLSIRIGMHSGPVTAGVLRGERARFQLFGDTVNTTARMESSGLPNRIQVSQETAKYLIDAGKGQWLKARQDTIVAKGKGEMK